MLFGRDVTVDGEWSPEPEATEFVKTRGLEGRMLTWFDYGEYAIWQLSPNIRVSMDGRRETVYSDEMRALHQRIYTNQPDALDAVARLAPDYIWLPRRLPVTDRLQTAGWQPLYSGARSTILAFPHHRRSAS